MQSFDNSNFFKAWKYYLYLFFFKNASPARTIFREDEHRNLNVFLGRLYSWKW
jgi:hypothetical protein